MAVVVTHAKVSAVPDAGNSTYVQPSDWNAEHTVAGALPLDGGTMTGDLIIAKASPRFTFNKAASGQAAFVTAQMNGNNRWAVAFGDVSAESTGNAGSNFVISRYSDGGSKIDEPLVINRATGAITTIAPVVLPAATTAIPSLRMPQGAAPTTPTNGDMWTQSDGLYVRIAGVTYKMNMTAV